MKNKLIMILAAASVLALSACGSTPQGTGGSAAPDTNAEPIKVTVGVTPIAINAPIYLGKEKGFFADEGLDVELKSTAGGAGAVPSVLSGDYQFADSNLVSIMVARDKGLDLKFVAAGGAAPGTVDTDTSAVFVLPDSPIKTAADLADKTVSVNTLANIGDTTIRYIVDQAGGDSSTIKFVEVAFPDALAALQNKQVDAVWVVEPFVTVALSQGARVVSYNFVGTDPNLDIGGFFATGDTIKNNPEMTKKFTVAMNKSLEYAQAHPQEVRDIVGTYTKISPELREKMVLNAFHVKFNRQADQILGDAAAKFGTISKKPDLDALLP